MRLSTPASVIAKEVFSFRRLRPPSSTLFPYTTLFRSTAARGCAQQVGSALQEALSTVPAESASCKAERSEEHTSELQSPVQLVSRLLREKITHYPTTSLGPVALILSILLSYYPDVIQP